MKLERLIRTAGIEAIPFKQKYVAIKIHFGEPGNLSFLRPNFAKTVADRIKALGGLPFLPDCNTLYVGRRNNALVHMDAAYACGYSRPSGNWNFQIIGTFKPVGDDVLTARG